MTMLEDVRPVRSSAAESVAHAVRAGSLPSLVAFYGQDLTLLACTEGYAASWDATPEGLCGRFVVDVLTGVEAEQLIPHLLRSVLGATVHVGLAASTTTVTPAARSSRSCRTSWPGSRSASPS